MTTKLKNQLLEHAAGEYFSVDPQEILETYNILVKAKDTQPQVYAENIVPVWPPFAHMSVKDLIAEIEGSVILLQDLLEDINPLNNIDWEELKKQKEIVVALGIRYDISPEEDDGIRGLVHLLDHLQDYAVDIMGKPEDKIFGVLE